DLEHSPVRPQPAVEPRFAQRGRGDPEDEVGAGAVADDALADAFEQPREQARGRGLAVGAGDHDRTLGEVVRQAGEDPGVDRPRDVAGKRRATAPPCHPAQDAGGLARPDRGRFADRHPAALLTAVHPSIPFTACRAYCSVRTALKNAEPLPVSCQPAPSRLANSTRRGSTRSAAARRWLGAEPFTWSQAA